MYRGGGSFSILGVSSFESGDGNFGRDVEAAVIEVSEVLEKLDEGANG